MSFIESENGFKFEKSKPVFEWMINNYPKSKYGYLGMSLYTLATKDSTAIDYCKKVIEMDPNYFETKTTTFWDEHNKKKIKECLSKN